MTFEYPDALWGLWFIPILGLAMALGGRRARRTVASFVGGARQVLLLRVLAAKHAIAAGLMVVAFASLGLAIAEPRWGEMSVEDERRGLDIVFAIDVSNSMVAPDLAPSRLHRAREISRSIAGRLEGAFGSVVAFKGTATVIVPMTEDPVAFEVAMGNLSGALITGAGTDLGNAIDVARSAFPVGSPRHQAVVLMSDGDSLSNVASEVLERLRQADIPVLAVVTGSSLGSTIPTRSGSALLDQDGRPVISRANRSAMERIASVSGGAVYDAADPGVAQEIARDLLTLSGEGRDVIFRQEDIARYQVFALVAFLCIVAATLIQHLRWRSKI